MHLKKCESYDVSVQNYVESWQKRWQKKKFLVKFFKFSHFILFFFFTQEAIFVLRSSELFVPYGLFSERVELDVSYPFTCCSILSL